MFDVVTRKPPPVLGRPDCPVLKEATAEMKQTVEDKTEDLLAAYRERNALEHELLDLYGHIFRDGGRTLDRMRLVPDVTLLGQERKARFAAALTRIDEERTWTEQARRRYNLLRRLTPMQFMRLYEYSTKTGEGFDELLDGMHLDLISTTPDRSRRKRWWLG